MVTETKLEHCPFSDQTLPCVKPDCGECEIKIKAEALVAQRAYENLEDYWMHLADGAER